MRYTIEVPVDPSWQPDHKLRLYKGTEGAADLASSTPAGGSPFRDMTIGKAEAGSNYKISFDHRASSACTQLPIGVSCIDGAGNESAKVELLIDISQPPEPPGRPDVAATVNPGEAQLSWTASPDL
ncbi:MAG: hypothetical protein AAF085_17340 [Planctomycetota bacterium]